MHSADFVFTDPFPDRDNPHPHVPELITIHHDGFGQGGGSGNVIINLEAFRVSSSPLQGEKRNGQDIVEVYLPFEILAKLVAEAVLAHRISTLEQAEYKEVLGLT
jgi:hypothetical protein